MDESIVAVTGANRGIGLEMVRQLLQRGDTVFALTRRPAAPALVELERGADPRLVVVRCDVADDAAVERAGAAIRERSDRLDVVVNGAGVYGSGRAAGAEIDFDEIRHVFEVNTFGPLRVAQALHPVLRRGQRPRLVNITSLMGSIADNTSGGAWAYRLSKAALNMATRNLAHAWAPDGITCVAMHPGWVRTDMGGAGAPLGVTEAVTAMLQTIDRLDAGKTGRFLDREGADLPW